MPSSAVWSSDREDNRSFNCAIKMQARLPEAVSGATNSQDFRLLQARVRHVCDKTIAEKWPDLEAKVSDEVGRRTEEWVARMSEMFEKITELEQDFELKISTIIQRTDELGDRILKLEQSATKEFSMAIEIDDLHGDIAQIHEEVTMLRSEVARSKLRPVSKPKINVEEVS